MEGASAVTIAISGSNEQRPARVVGRSACDDLAVLKVENTAGLQPVKFGQSSALKVGEQVYALGDDIGVELSITQGIVSKRGVSLGQYQSLIQTDAAINHGNSGGPLVNRYGNVIGINTLGYNAAVATNINFAISIDQAESVIPALQQGTNGAWLDLNLVPNEYAKHFGTDQGVVVAGVDSGSPADKAGIKPAALLMSIESMVEQAGATPLVLPEGTHRHAFFAEPWPSRWQVQGGQIGIVMLQDWLNRGDPYPQSVWAADIRYFIYRGAADALVPLIRQYRVSHLCMTGYTWAGKRLPAHD